MSRLPTLPHLRLAVCFSFWRHAKTPAPATGDLARVLAGALAGAGLAGAQWSTLAEGADYGLEPAGLTWSIGVLCGASLLAARGLRGPRRAPALIVFLLLIAIGAALFAGLWTACALLPDSAALAEQDRLPILAPALLLWFAGACHRLTRWCDAASNPASTDRSPHAGATWSPRSGAGRSARAAGISLALPVALFLLPGPWIVDDAERGWIDGTVWAPILQLAREMATPADADERPKTLSPLQILNRRQAELELRQPALLDQALAALAPRAPGQNNLFVLGLATDMDGDVFPRELFNGLDIFASRFGTADRTVRLVNHLDYVDRFPVASRQNLAAAIAGIARRMDRDTDLIFIYLTSHGSTAGLHLDMGRLASGALAPEALRRLLDDAGIRNRVIAVSACHSGVFIPALKGPTTAIITAAAADRTSFGCSNENNWTYFGDALFNSGFAKTATIPAAFHAARHSVTLLEIAKGVPPSLPQIDLGADLSTAFPALFPAADMAPQPFAAAFERLVRDNDSQPTADERPAAPTATAAPSAAP